MSTAAIAVSALMYWVLQVRPLTTSQGFSWQNFRDYFPYDQASYLAIAVNVKNGNMAPVEPFTETGMNHYPRLYYVFLGLLSRLFNADIIPTWQVTGLALQFVMVVAISWLLIRLTGRSVFGVLGFVPSIIGTFAVAAAGDWHHTLESHGVLWGAFGVLFTLNGESAALSIAVTAICLLIGTTFPLLGGKSSAGPKTSTVMVIVAATAVGVLANVQTYSFLTAVYLLVYVVAIQGLLDFGHKQHFALSIALLLAVLSGGTAIADISSPLVTLMAGLLAAMPGFILVFVRYKVAVSAGCAALALAASPTILGTLLGLAGKDDFLVYRELSSEALGVPLPIGLIAALVPSLMLAVIFWAGVVQRNKTWMSYAAGSAVAWLLVASNDLWGANQEPYRFWIDSFTIISATALPVLCQVGVYSWRFIGGRLHSEPVAVAALAEDFDQSDVRSRSERTHTTVCIAGFAIVAATLAASLADYSKFATFVHASGTSSFNGAQANAIESAAQPLTDAVSELRIKVDEEGEASELVMFDPCISPFLVKAITGLPTAFYNLGLAWPANENALREVLKRRAAGQFAQPLAEQAGVRYVLTDTGCGESWQTQVHGTKLNEVEYDNGGAGAAVALWRIAG